MLFAQFISQWQVGRVSIFNDDFGNYFSCDSYDLIKDGLDECFRRDGTRALPFSRTNLAIQQKSKLRK
jgi:hypothetical protein